MRKRGDSVGHWGTAAVVLGLITACGTAVPHDQVVQAAHGVGGVGAGGDHGTAPGIAGEGGAAEPSGAAGNSTAAGSGSGSTGSGAAPGAGVAAVPGQTDSQQGPGATTGPESGSGSGPAGGDRSPIIIGTVGNFSGAPGVVNKPAATGVQVWVAAVNARGGINGHPVKNIQVDDQADPARYRQILQDLVENKHVIAFVGNGTSLTAEAGRSYLEKVRVPVIGVGDGSEVWQSSKMHFPSVGSAAAVTYGDLELAKQQGKTKIAVLACVEASSCAVWAASARKYAPRTGTRIVYEANISITQADFTSECLNARQAGAEVMAVIADQNTSYRAAASCAQQDYKPTYIGPVPADADTKKPLLEGEIGAMHTFPFFGVPGSLADEYTSALKRYGADSDKSMLLSSGWASGKLFEAAFSKGVGTGKPSSAGVLAGLWALPKGETLGGWVPPINFRKEQPATQAFCYYAGIIARGKWTAPNGMTPTCVKP